MNSIEYIKSEIERLYKTAPEIHVTVKLTRPKVIIEGASARIVGVYKNIFQIEECQSDHPARHTLRYGDVLIGQVVIHEMNSDE